MKLHINGEPRDFAALKTLTDLVATLGLQPSMILIEHNGQATRPRMISRVLTGK